MDKLTFDIEEMKMKLDEIYALVTIDKTLLAGENPQEKLDALIETIIDIINGNYGDKWD